MRKQDEKRILAAQMNCLRRIAEGYKLRNDGIRQALGSQSTLLDKIVQRKLRWAGQWTCRMHTMHYMQDSKEKMKQRLTQTTMHRQCKGGHRISWTDIEGSNGLDKGLRTMEAIHSYPSPPNGWLQELMMMLLYLSFILYTQMMRISVRPYL